MVLKNVSLAAIVRDELHNPAGGIVRFADAVLPHVEEAVIVDTGSVDGTREALEELQARYSHLRVCDVPFRGYAHARNASLARVRTRYALVLDADELIRRSDWQKLAARIDTEPHVARWIFPFWHILPDGTHDERPQHPRRLFRTAKERYIRQVWETLADREGVATSKTDVPILHFLPPENGLIQKEGWYVNQRSILESTFVSGDQRRRQANRLARPTLDSTYSPGGGKSESVEHGAAGPLTPAPTTLPDAAFWKAYNPQRDKYA